MIASMYKSVEGTLVNMGNMPKKYWSNIAPILGAIGDLSYYRVVDRRRRSEGRIFLLIFGYSFIDSGFGGGNEFFFLSR